MRWDKCKLDYIRCIAECTLPSYVNSLDDYCFSCQIKSHTHACMYTYTHTYIHTYRNQIQSSYNSHYNINSQANNTSFILLWYGPGGVGRVGTSKETQPMLWATKSVFVLLFSVAVTHIFVYDALALLLVEIICTNRAWMIKFYLFCDDAFLLSLQFAIQQCSIILNIEYKW